ncbi:fatty acid desaturase CarF family protein [Sphingomonas sp. PB4P5]|uniref:fatty acid desaturase CarF family protein n=1 Tax=Parasphingomonas puruogangriensis TaxID=3096155 RepID=UPI002FC7CDA8
MTQRIVLGLFLISVAVNVAAMFADLSLACIPALIVGWYLADLASGLTHMLLDYRPTPAGKRLDELYFYAGSRESGDYLTLVRERMASVSAFDRLVYDFKNHHPRPMALGRRPVWRLIGSTVLLAALPISLALNLAVIVLAVPGWLTAASLAVIIGGAFAQYFHGTLHRERNPVIIGWMRASRLLMTPAAHQAHHDTLQRDFATNCGWSNPVINRLFLALRARGYLCDKGLVPNA